MGRGLFLRLSMIFIVAVMGIFALSGLGLASEFSADMITKDDGEASTAKIYVKGKNMRQEMLKGSETSVVIMRMDKGVVWVLMPAQKMYMEVMSPAGGAAYDPELEQKTKNLAEKKYLGKEKVNGYVCEKIQYVYHDKAIGTTTQWLSKKLNYPIKVEHKSPTINTLAECKNIKEKKLPDSLFEIPSDYQKMGMPDMPGMPK